MSTNPFPQRRMDLGVRNCLELAVFRPYLKDAATNWTDALTRAAEGLILYKAVHADVVNDSFDHAFGTHQIPAHLRIDGAGVRDVICVGLAGDSALPPTSHEVEKEICLGRAWWPIVFLFTLLPTFVGGRLDDQRLVIVGHFAWTVRPSEKEPRVECDGAEEEG